MKPKTLRRKERSAEDLILFKKMKTTRCGGLGILYVEYQKRLKRKNLDKKHEEMRIKKEAERKRRFNNSRRDWVDEVFCEGSQDEVHSSSGPISS